MHGGARKFFSLEERRLIEKYIGDGMSATQISKLISRSKNGVLSEIRRGGGSAYNATKSHNDFIIRTELRYKNVSELNKTRAKKHHWTTRILNLEMQMEILYDTIKGILNDRKD